MGIKISPSANTDRADRGHRAFGKYLSQTALVCIGYFVAGRLGLAVPFTSGNVSPVWPAWLAPQKHSLLISSCVEGGSLQLVFVTQQLQMLAIRIDRQMCDANHLAITLVIFIDMRSIELLDGHSCGSRIALVRGLTAVQF